MSTFTWSFTSLNEWETCRRRWQAKYVYKQREPENEWTLEGKRIHKALEKRALGVPLPKDLEHCEKYGQAIDFARQAKWLINTELKLGITRTMEPTEFFAPNVWLRVVLDLQMLSPQTGIVIDWKTGKPKDDDTQLRMFAGVTFIHHPELREVRTKYVWTKTGTQSKETYTMQDRYTRIWQPIIPRVQRMEEGATAQRFEPTPNWTCKGCMVRDCEHYKERK